MEEKPQRVRLSVKRGMAPPPGSFVEVKALLDPPLQPLEPGSYDFARDLYFQRIGASGFVRGAVKVIAPPPRQGLLQRVANAVISGLRDAIDARIRAVLAGRSRRDRRDADQRPARRDRSASLRRHVRFRHRPRAVDLRLSHGGRRRRHLFHLPRRLGADPGARRSRADQEMGRVRGAARHRVLSGAVGQSGRDATLLHHDRGRADRRHARPADLDHAHADGRGAARAVLRAGSGGASELPDVVCGDAGADRRLRARRGQAARQRRQFARRARGAVGRQRNRRPDARLAARRLRHHALRRLSLPSPRALWRARQPSRHAGGVRLGDADGDIRRRRHAVRLRCGVLAANGLRHRMDGRRRAVGGEPAGRVRPRHRVRHRAASSRDRGPSRHRLAEDAAALERRVARALRRDLGRTHAAAGRAGGRRRAHLRGARRRRPARVPSHRRRHVCDPRMARGRRRWPRCPRSRAGRGDRLRSVGLHRQARRRRLVAYTLAPDAFEDDCRRASPHRGDARSAAGLRRDGDRARPIGATRGALALRRDRLRLCDRVGAAANFDRPWAPAPAPPQRAAADSAAAPVPDGNATACRPRDATPQPEISKRIGKPPQ